MWIFPHSPKSDTLFINAVDAKKEGGNKFMIFILYASLILFIGVLIFLDRVAVKTYRSARPKVEHIQGTIKRMQEQTDLIKTEAIKLSEYQRQMLEKIEDTRNSLETAATAAKQTPEMVKEFFSALYTQRKKN
jgi:uncharacterized protein YoxC